MSPSRADIPKRSASQRIKAVILDLDGLIIDSEPLHQRAVNVFLAQHHIDHEFSEDEYGELFVGIPVRANAEYIISRFRLSCSVDEFVDEREALFEALIGVSANLTPMPGLFELLGRLEQRGLDLAVASASPGHQVHTMLRGLGIADRFQTVVTGSDVTLLKPAPDVYLEALRRLDVPIIAAIAVEDSATGVASARAAGLRVIGIPNRFTRRQAMNADVTLPNLSQVIGFIDKE